MSIKMSERVCDVDGKKKPLSGGRTCESGHFICKDHIYSGVIFIDEKKVCPLCKKPLR